MYYLYVTDDEKRHDGLLSPCPRGPGRSHHHARSIRPREERLRRGNRIVFIEHRCDLFLAVIHKSIDRDVDLYSTPTTGSSSNDEAPPTPVMNSRCTALGGV